MSKDVACFRCTKPSTLQTWMIRKALRQIALTPQPVVAEGHLLHISFRGFLLIQLPCKDTRAVRCTLLRTPPVLLPSPNNGRPGGCPPIPLMLPHHSSAPQQAIKFLPHRRHFPKELVKTRKNRAAQDTLAAVLS